MSGQHTPGPWVSIHGKSAGTQDCFYIHSEGAPLAPRITTVFVHNGAFSRAKTNARLIAAAPALLDALQKLVSVASSPSYQIGYVQAIEGATDEARAAIAKATGEQA